jgi:hypothetical protein
MGPWEAAAGDHKGGERSRGQGRAHRNQGRQGDCRRADTQGEGRLRRTRYRQQGPGLAARREQCRGSHVDFIWAQGLAHRGKAASRRSRLELGLDSRIFIE